MLIDSLRVTYNIHVERLITKLPEYEELLRNVLLITDFVEKVCLILQMKADQAKADGQYHNSVLGFPIAGLENPSYGVFEVGCTSHLNDFRNYWSRLGYDSYEDYLQGILSNDGKGFDLYEQFLGPEGSR